MFLFRALFWVGALVIALPLVTGGGSTVPADYDPEPVQLHELATMVQVAASDIMSLCERKPEVCDTSHRLLWTARGAATNLAGRAHIWLQEGPPEGEEIGS